MIRVATNAARVVRAHNPAALCRANAALVRGCLRIDFRERCAYCLVHAHQIGIRHFEIDHHRPRARGGTEDYRNLYWSCRACNGIKWNIWPSRAESQGGSRFCDPCAEWDAGVHYVEKRSGELKAVTACGDYHIVKLGLNRADLVKWRAERSSMSCRIRELRKALMRAQRSNMDPGLLASAGAALAHLERQVSTLISPIPNRPTRAAGPPSARGP